MGLISRDLGDKITVHRVKPTLFLKYHGSPGKWTGTLQLLAKQVQLCEKINVGYSYA